MSRTWITGENGNRASIELWGSEEAARASLAKLKNCSDCSGCSDCSNCSDCWGKKNASPVEAGQTAPEADPYPVIPDIHKAIYAACSAPGALDMDRFHVCETTHCRAGLAVHLAGEAGYRLEKRTSSVFAAMMIYKASGAPISPCRFFDDGPTAMADMKRLADGASA